MNRYAFVVPDELSGKKLGILLKPQYSLEYRADEEESAVLLDTFDEELRAEGKLLVQSGANLMLLDQKEGSFSSQPGQARLLCQPWIEEGPVKQRLAAVSGLRAFLPIGEFRFCTGTWLMLDDERKTVARLHSFLFRRKKRQAQFLLVEPVRGYDEELAVLVSALEKVVIENDFSTCLGVKSFGYNPKPALQLDGEAGAKKTANTIISAFIQVARMNEKGIQADYDTEFLHDYRVGFRKVRSVVSLFKGIYSQEDTDYLKREFADIMQVTGRMRDLDVYLLDREKYYSMVPDAAHGGLDILFAHLVSERKQLHKKLCKTLKTKGYTKRVKSLATGFADDLWGSGPLAEKRSHAFACTLISKRYRKVCSIARTIDDNTPDEVVHNLRIHCKKLRYLMEFFTPIFAREIKGLIKSLKVLQDNLGRFNDYSVQQESLAAFLDQNLIKGKDRVRVAESIGALTAMLNLLQKEERAKVVENFSRFDSRETRARFKNLFSQEEKVR